MCVCINEKEKEKRMNKKFNHHLKERGKKPTSYLK